MPTSVQQILSSNLPLGYTGSRGSDGYTGSFGYTGSVGYAGSKGNSYVGDNPPVSPTNGDTWYNSTDGIRYVYYNDGSSSQWVQETTMGPRGDTGYVGSKGDIGYTGSTGYTGSQGTTGYVGSKGDIGYTGSTGYTGSIGYTGSRGPTTIPQSGSDKTTSYILQTSDVGGYVGVGSGGSITIPNSTFSNGDVVTIYNNTAGNITITCSITTAYISGVDTDKATVTLATRGLCTIFFISGTVCVISGAVS